MASPDRTMPGKPAGPFPSNKGDGSARPCGLAAVQSQSEDVDNTAPWNILWCWGFAPSVLPNVGATTHRWQWLLKWGWWHGGCERLVQGHLTELKPPHGAGDPLVRAAVQRDWQPPANTWLPWIIPLLTPRSDYKSSHIAGPEDLVLKSRAEVVGMDCASLYTLGRHPHHKELQCATSLGLLRQNWNRKKTSEVFWGWRWWV